MRFVQALVVVATLAVIVGIVALVWGGDDGPAGPQLSAAGARGKQLAVQRSCTGCHGVNGEGSSGPPWVGLFGSTVALLDGSTVVADRAYLAESIVNPNAKRRAGFGQMPQDQLSDGDVAALVQYIVELAAPSDTTGGG